MVTQDPYATAREHGLMQGTPPPPEARVTRGNWFYAPHNRWAFSNATRLIPTAEVRRGEEIRALPEQLVDPASVESLVVTDHAGTERTAGEMMTRTYSDAFLVLKSGTLVYERYDNDLQPDQLHLLASVTKSFTGLLTLLAIHDGLLDPGALAVTYVPELEGGVFAETTVQQVLDMVVAAEWDELSWLETEAGPDQADSQFLGFLRATGTWVDAQHVLDHGVWEYAARLQKAGQHGDVFMYRDRRARLDACSGPWPVVRRPAVRTDLVTHRRRASSARPAGPDRHRRREWRTQHNSARPRPLRPTVARRRSVGQ